jgi:hypothetical protein
MSLIDILFQSPYLEQTIIDITGLGYREEYEMEICMDFPTELSTSRVPLTYVTHRNIKISLVM